MDNEQLAIELDAVPHPGETVVEYLDFNGWSQRDLARRTGLTPKTISEICNGKGPISPSTAMVFERALERPAHFWLNLQRQYDEFLARRHSLAQLAGWNEWSKQFPIKEMRKLNYSIPSGRSDTDSLLNFFGVSSPDSWRSVWQSAGVSYRQTRRFKLSEEAIASWVREVELTAREFTLADYSEQRLRGSLADLRRLTREPVDRIMDPVQATCSGFGVAVVWVEALQKTGISGCTRWLSDKTAVVGLTLRYRYDDQMWFTFFHELGHVLHHRTRQSFVVDNAEDVSDQTVDPEMQQIENEANQFASDVLLPPRTLSEFINKGIFTNEAIHEFAEQQGVGPGIVVGRLQREGILGRHQGNALKQRIGTRPADEEA
jgi:HTH-type transcriptional regulator / antitoxin HigA